MGDHSKTQTQNFYSILGIPKNASLTDICKAYKSLVLKWHPDRNPNNKAEAEAKFNSISEAYRVMYKYHHVMHHYNLNYQSTVINKIIQS